MAGENLHLYQCRITIERITFRTKDRVNEGARSLVKLVAASSNNHYGIYLPGTAEDQDVALDEVIPRGCC